jgi:hypothetical protein
MIVGLVIYWFTGWPLKHAPSNPTPVAATAVEASQPQTGFYDKTRQAAEQGNPESQSEARFAFVAHAGFGQVQIIVQILQFLAQRGDLLALAGDEADTFHYSEIKISSSNCPEFNSRHGFH